MWWANNVTYFIPNSSIRVLDIRKQGCLKKQNKGKWYHTHRILHIKSHTIIFICRHCCSSEFTPKIISHLVCNGAKHLEEGWKVIVRLLVSVVFMFNACHARPRGEHKIVVTLEKTIACDWSDIFTLLHELLDESKGVFPSRL